MSTVTMMDSSALMAESAAGKDNVKGKGSIPLVEWHSHVPACPFRKTYGAERCACKITIEETRSTSSPITSPGYPLGTPGEVPPPPPTPAEIAREIVDPFHHGNFSSTGDRVVREITDAIPLQSERDGQAKRILAVVETAKEASDEWEVVLQKRIEELKGGLKAAWHVANIAANGNIKMKSIIAEQKERITELKRQLAADDLAFEHANTVIKKYMDDLSPSPCGVKGHCKVDWTERRAGERRGNAVPGIEDRRKYGSGGSWLERRITNPGGYCRRCKEINRACAEAELSEAERQGERIEKAVTDALEAAGQYIPGDLRALGWSVATHNDYRQDGKFHTFWLLTKSGQCVKGEGESDAEALNQIRVAILGKAVKG